MILRAFLILLLVAGCGRPLTDTELAFAQSIQGDGLNAEKVRFVRGAPVGSVTFTRKARPRVTCRERIVPPAKEETVTVTPAAVTLFNKVYFSKDWYATDYMATYPDRISLVAAMLIAHELTHVWQWQNRDRTGYHPMLAAAEHGNNDDPYLFDLEATPDFLSYGFEQQGSIVEEYVCCRALDPGAARTRRLHDMIGAEMPLSDLPRNGHREWDVVIPWKGAELKGICS